MTDIAISALPAQSPVASTALVAVVESATTSRATVADVVLGGKALLKDGSVPAEADIDLGGFKIVSLSPGTTTGDAVEYDQMVAADAAAVAASESYADAGDAAVMSAIPAADGVTITGTSTFARAAITGDISIPAGSNTSAFASGAFGALAVTTTTGYFSVGTTPAATGALRIPNATTAVAGRNAANTADLVLLRVDSSDTVSVGDVTGTGIRMTLAGAIGFRIGGADVATYSSSAYSLAAGVHIAMGTTPATAGDFRLYHSFSIEGRDVGNAANRNGVRWGVTANDTWTFGDAAVPTELLGSEVDIGDTSAFIGVQVEYVASARYVTAIGFAAPITATEMPTGSGSGVVTIAECLSAPTTPGTNPILFVDSSGNTCILGPSGTLTIIAPA